jgi:two-component system response regulator FixJ
MVVEGVVHVIDDDDAMRDSLAFMLDVHGFRARVYPSATAFIAEIGAAESGCVVTDVRMPDMTGLELVQAMKSADVQFPVVVMTGHGDVPLAVEAMKAGVVDFIEKPFADEVFLDAVRTALALARQGGGADQAKAAAEERLAHLTPRERDVLQGVVAGKVNKVIAYELDISPRTVEIYRANLMSKTGARNISELMRIALAAGL